MINSSRNWPNAIATEYGSLTAISDIIDKACLTATGSENSILQLYEARWEHNDSYAGACSYFLLLVNDAT
jgi:hypothetical protein